MLDYTVLSRRYVALPAVVVFVALFSGCASTSGGGSQTAPSPAPVGVGNPYPPDTTTPPAPAIPDYSTLPAGAPTSAETSVRGYQIWLNQTNTPYLNQLGTGNGAGVTVGVVDSGVQVNHPMLAGRIAASFNTADESSNVADTLGHGTHVAGIIAGAIGSSALGTGVAPGAKLAIAKAFVGATTDSTQVAKGIDWAVNVQAVPILNLSLGTGVAAMQGSIQNAVTKGTLIVAALGNAGLNNAADWPAEFAKETWANNQIIAVGAVTNANTRASFSNVDPALAAWTVYAPGVNVASSLPGNNIGYMSGTSMATPIVAGQAALLKSNWAFLSANNLARIVFQSATRMCSDGASALVCQSRTTADPVYGWGVVNVGASLQPIGGLSVSSNPGAIVTYAGSKLATPKSGLASGLNAVVTAVDSFNRGFRINVASVAGTTVKSAAIPVASSPSTAVADFAADAAYASAEDAQKTGALARYGMNFSDDAGHRYVMGFGGSNTRFLGLDAKGLTPLSLSGEAGKFNSPFFQLMDSGLQLGYATRWPDGAITRFAAMQQGDANGIPTKALHVIEVQKSWKQSTAVLSMGQLNERDSTLGLRGEGALALGGQTNTYFATLAASKSLGSSLEISGMVSLGFSSAFNNGANSLISGMSGSRSMAWSLGLAHRDVLRNGDALGITASMPLRTMDGELYMDSAVGQSSSDGSLIYGRQSFELSPDGREFDLELSYRRPLTKGALLALLAQIKLQPGHRAMADTQYGLGVKATVPF